VTAHFESQRSEKRSWTRRGFGIIPRNYCVAAFCESGAFGVLGGCDTAICVINLHVMSTSSAFDSRPRLHRDIDALRPNGKLMRMGVTFDPMEVAPLQLVSGNRTIQGWAAGRPTDSEDTLRFAQWPAYAPRLKPIPLTGHLKLTTE
jgi:hypothetical protein